MRMELNSIMFNTNVPDSDGALWFVTEWEGWDSGDLRLSDMDPSSRHGSVNSEALLAARSLSISGVCKAPDEDAFWKAFNRLGAVTSNLFTPMPFVASEDVDKTLWVTRAGKVNKRMTGVAAFEFEVPLVARDPLKYGDFEAPVRIPAGATVNLTNDGNFSSERIVVTTTGGGTLKLIHLGTGQYLTSSTTPVGSNTVYDFYQRTAYRNMNPRYFQLSTTSQWWALAPGANSIKNEGTAPISVTYRPAWD